MTAAQARVLAALRGAGRPLTLAELVAGTGLHENTLRGHLDALVAGDKVTRFAVRGGGRGRPAWRFAARDPEYAALALALAAGLDSAVGETGAREAAVRAGRHWGSRLRSELMTDGTDERDVLLLALEHAGFGPDDAGEAVWLSRCPLIDAARAHPRVVCGVHQGLIEGVLGRTGAVLEPFVTADTCRVRP